MTCAGVVFAGQLNESAAAMKLIHDPRAGIISWAAAAPHGSTVFAFNLQDSTNDGFPTGCEPPRATGLLGYRRADGSLVALGKVDPPAGPIVTVGGRMAIVTYTDNCSVQSAQPEQAEATQRLTLMSGPVGARPGHPVALTNAAEPESTAIAVDGAGDVAVSWLSPVTPRSDPDGHDVLYLSRGRLSGALSRPQIIAGTGVVDGAKLAWTSDRTLIVAYDELRAHRPPGTHSMFNLDLRTWPRRGVLSTAAVLGHARHGEDVALAVGRDGRAAVAWIAGSGPSSAVATEVRTHPGGPLSSPRTVATHGQTGGFDDIQVQIGDDGVASVAAVTKSEHVVATTVTAAGTAEPLQNLGPIDDFHDYKGRFSLWGPPGAPTTLQWSSAGAIEQSTRPGGSSTFGAAAPAAQADDEVDGVGLVDSATGVQHTFTS